MSLENDVAGTTTDPSEGNRLQDDKILDDLKDIIAKHYSYPENFSSLEIVPLGWRYKKKATSEPRYFIPLDDEADCYTIFVKLYDGLEPQFHVVSRKQHDVLLIQG